MHITLENFVFFYKHSILESGKYILLKNFKFSITIAVNLIKKKIFFMNNSKNFSILSNTLLHKKKFSRANCENYSTLLKGKGNPRHVLMQQRD